jgi:hypothetical protein
VTHWFDAESGLTEYNKKAYDDKQMHVATKLDVLYRIQVQRPSCSGRTWQVIGHVMCQLGLYEPAESMFVTPAQHAAVRTP